MAKLNLEKYKTLSERYSKALLKIAQQDNTVDKVGAELKEIAKIFVATPDIESFFTSPIITKNDKKEILELSFKAKLNEKLYSFLNILIDKNRMYILQSVSDIYQKKLAEMENILEVEAQSVISLDNDMQNLLQQKLSNITGKNVALKNTINENIIGGMVLLYNDKVIDGSIKTQLEKLQKQLI